MISRPLTSGSAQLACFPAMSPPQENPRGNLGLPDAKSRYGLSSDEIERHIRDFIDQVSAAG
jgi:hypothetical protein